MPSFSFSGLGPSVLRFPVVSLVLVDRSWFVLGVPDRVVDLLGVRCSRCGWFFFEVALDDLLFAELLHLEDMLFHSSAVPLSPVPGEDWFPPAATATVLSPNVYEVSALLLCIFLCEDDWIQFQQSFFSQGAGSKGNTADNLRTDWPLFRVSSWYLYCSSGDVLLNGQPLRQASAASAITFTHQWRSWAMQVSKMYMLLCTCMQTWLSPTSLSHKIISRNIIS